ncbi:MAG: hypothetical protein AB7O47_07895 [Flavobacteriales bacterium]
MSFSIPITKNISEINLQQGVFIFIHRASKVPPHIGMVVNGVLFEISTIGPGYTHKAIDLLKTSQKRGVELIFLELKESSRSLTELKEIMLRFVKYYRKVDEEITCLFPIKDFIQEVYQVEVSKANFIFNLLPVLYDNDCIINSYEVNLTDKLKDNSFELKKYTKQDIDKCVAAVNRKNNLEVSC